MSKIQAVILAGGQGSRLRPYTTVLPKPLLPVGEFPVAEILIRQLKNCGIENIVISTGHLAGLIEAYFSDGRQWGVNIRYIREHKPLGTAGALRMVDNLEDAFLVINGDILTDVNFRRLLEFHQERECIATLVCKERSVKTDFGVIQISVAGDLVDYLEKPEHKSFVSTGINVFDKEATQYIEKSESLGMPDLMLRMKNDGKKIRCYPTTALWLDLGRFDDLELAQDVFSENKDKYLKSEGSQNFHADSYNRS